MSTTAVTADDIDRALAERHKRDVYVSECKTGPTLTGTHRRLDAWVLQRSYSPLRTIGYEIKVSRADFSQDQKWVEYLDYCHSFYFVCPAGLIKSSELPEDVGLLWMTRSGRLHEKKRARRREPGRIMSLLLYVLMSRSRIVLGNEANGMQSTPSTREGRMAAYRAMIDAAAQRHELALFVAGHVRTAWNDAAMRLREAREIATAADDVRALLAQYGLSLHDAWMRCGLRHRLSSALGLADMEAAVASLESAERQIREIRERGVQRLADAMRSAGTTPPQP
jgi:hypothetical protein